MDKRSTNFIVNIHKPSGGVLWEYACEALNEKSAIKKAIKFMYSQNKRAAVYRYEVKEVVNVQGVLC